MLLGRRAPLGAFLADHLGIVFSFRWTGAALACGVMGFPLMVRAIRLSIEAIDRRLENAAGTLGANGPWTFALITLPLALPGILVGAILCFAKALGEFGATITFVSNIPGETQTISAAIYTYTQVPGGDAAAWRLTAVAIVIALGALVSLGAGPALRQSPGGAVRMIRFDAAIRLGAFPYEAAFESPASVSLFGRSGSGKTVTLGLIAGLLRPDRGVIVVDDRVLVDTRKQDLRAQARPPDRHRLPGRAAVSAPHGAAEPVVRPLVRPAHRARHRIQRRRRDARHRPSAHPAAGPAVRRRAPAGGDRPRACCRRRACS